MYFMLFVLICVFILQRRPWVEGTAVISMMDILREVAVQCGVVSGCRVRGEKNFEMTMKDEVGKRKLLDGVRVKAALVHERL